MELWFRSFSFLFMGDGGRFQPFIFQGVVGIISVLFFSARNISKIQPSLASWVWFASWRETPCFPADGCRIMVWKYPQQKNEMFGKCTCKKSAVQKLIDPPNGLTKSYKPYIQLVTIYIYTLVYVPV